MDKLSDKVIDDSVGWMVLVGYAVIGMISIAVAVVGAIVGVVWLLIK